MSPDHVTDLIRQALFIALQISAPLLILAMLVGFGISVFQSVTQINEMTLTFVPKILVFAAAMMALFPWMLKIMISYTTNLLVHQWDKLVTFSNYVN